MKFVLIQRKIYEKCMENFRSISEKFVSFNENLRTFLETLVRLQQVNSGKLFANFK